MNPEKELELKDKHPGVPLHELTGSSGASIIVRSPDRATYKKFRAHMQDDRRKLDAPEVLLRSCILHPDSAAVDVLLDQQPGLVETFANKLLEIAGLEKSESVEKKAL